ncbi:LAMP3 protein, partial [Anthoscopus minutus]|nr:LAMP3 protein [Anthoscopus minutus]
AGQATLPATPVATAAVKNTATPSVGSTRHGRRPCVTIGTTAVATNTSLKHETASTQGAAATSASTATSTQRAGPSTRSQRQRTATGNPSATAVSSTATHTGTHTAPTSPATHTGTHTAPTSPATHAGTHTAPTSRATHAGTHTAPTSRASTVRPPPAPQPSAIPTGTYTLSHGNETCVKAVMGLQLMARNTEQEKMEYVTVNPNATKISGSCGMVQSELTLTFSGGFVNITFVK